MYRQNLHKFRYLSTLTNCSKHSIILRDSQLQRLRHIPEVTTTCCHYSTPSRKPNFFSQVLDNIKQEIAKNKEMKETLKKFREERQKLEESEALQQARKKYQTVESEASKGSEVFKKNLDTIREKVHDVIEEAGKTEIAKKAGHIRDELGKSAKDAAETISKRSQELSKTGAFQTVSQAAAAVKDEIDHSSIQARMYRPPVKLRKRKDEVENDAELMRFYSPNDQATGVELHKDSRFYQSWQNFKDNNPYMNKVLDWKMKYDESDNPVIRASRLLTEKVTDVMGGLFQKTDLSITLTEICKIDPNFDKSDFLKQCEVDFIPNILESMVRGDLDILRDWCHEGPYNILSAPIKKAKQMGLNFASKVLDVDNIDLVMGKVMEQGPVLVISFTSQQILCITDKTGKVIEGDPDKVFRVDYMWVLCRDSTELNPKAAWKLLDLSLQSREQLL